MRCHTFWLSLLLLCSFLLHESAANRQLLQAQTLPELTNPDPSKSVLEYLTKNAKDHNNLINPTESRQSTPAAGAQLRSKAPAQCTPFKPPPEFKNIQDYCKFLSSDDIGKYDRMFREAPPSSRAEGLGLKGCVVGCLVGNTLQTAVGSLPWNAGAWSGKCFNWFDSREPWVPTQVANVISPNKDLMDWTRGVGGIFAYPGEIKLANSRVDRKPVWVIDYANTPAFFGRDLSGFFDEMREVAPGFILGEVWIRPFTMPYNPSPLHWPSLKFALFQTCDANGAYTFNPGERVIGG